MSFIDDKFDCSLIAKVFKSYKNPKFYEVAKGNKQVLPILQEAY